MSSRPGVGDASTRALSEVFRASATRSVLDQVPGGLVALDATGRIVYLNDTAQRQLAGYPREPLFRDLFRDLFPTLESRGDGPRYRHAMGGGATFSIDAEAGASWGEDEKTFSLTIRPLLVDGALWGIAAIDDHAGEAIERARRRRTERLAAIGELATGFAHEINNPLAAIRGFAQLLARDAETPEERQALGIIEAESDRIARTVQNLHAFAKRQERAERVALELGSVVAGVVALRRYALETAGITVDLDLMDEGPRIVAEPDAVQRILLALLLAAEDAVSRRREGGRVAVRTRESTDGVVVQVEDNGDGIPRDRLRNLLTLPAPGMEESPFGLDVAAALAGEQGGQLWADTAPGRGSTIFVRFPRAEDAGAAFMTEELEPSEDRPLRVLVVDDEPALRMAIALFLTREGYTVVQAGSAADALRVAREQPFDVALVDARLQSDGVELLEALERLPTLSGRTIPMAGDAGDPRISGMMGSARPLLLKPFDMEDAVELVREVARASR